MKCTKRLFALAAMLLLAMTVLPGTALAANNEMTARRTSSRLSPVSWISRSIGGASKRWKRLDGLSLQQKPNTKQEKAKTPILASCD